MRPVGQCHLQRRSSLLVRKITSSALPKLRCMSRGHFYARLEETDWRFIRRSATNKTFDAAVVKASYLADYPEGDSRHGQRADRLTEALREREFSWALDPATAVFGHARAADWTSPRVQACPMA